MGSSWISDFAHFYQVGGWIMHVILLAALFSGGLGLVALLVRTRPVGLAALAVGLVTLGLGVSGRVLAQADVDAAVATVADDQRDMARAYGAELAAVPLQFGAICAAPGLLGGLLGLALARKR